MDVKTLKKVTKYLDKAFQQPELWSDQGNDGFKRGYQQAITDIELLISTLEEDEEE